ncbi:hypothetical protein EC957_000887 [Mortierella hygrophila]|uniref:F-box domain-containing protein n=1 Tax=Mortierella hygrophila TaxID=979708 RepID=A0A9P6F6A2_9FUNG|nr:hypothetical protein EC957_000887 [Mortierella hygrophila]
MESPLLLPEILLYITPYLTHQDIVICLKVCRQWNQSFTPLIFPTIIAQENWTTAKDFPPLLTLIKNAFWVRSLTLKTTIGLAPFLDQCTRLKTLVVHGDIFSKEQDTIWTELTSLVRHNPLIERIFLGFDRQNSPSIEFLRAVSEACPNLNRYESSQGKYEDQEQVEALMKLLQRIKCASTRYESFTDIPVDTTRSFPHLQELTIKDAKGLSTQLQVDLVCQCPHLQHLKWTVCRDMFFPIQQFCDRIPAACPNLRKLQMDGCGIPYPCDLSRILNSLSQLELLAFCGTAIFSRTFRAMERHFRTLRSLDLADCFSVKSWMVQEVLENCSVLETLKVPYILMSDVEFGRPWVALRLKQLRVHFRASMLWGAKYISEHEAIFKALGKLADLEILDVSCFNPRSPAGLQFQLDLGLAGMGMMRKLMFVNMHYTDQNIGNQELDWIKKHWPHLTKAKGIFHSAWDQHEAVTKELREHGIEVPDQERPDPDSQGSPWAFDARQDGEDTDNEEMDEDHEDAADYEYYLSDTEEPEDVVDEGHILGPSEVVFGEGSVDDEEDDGDGGDDEGGDMVDS